jgi:putative ABC transport system permease protein
MISHSLFLMSMTFRIIRRNLRKRPFLHLIKVIGLSLALSSLVLIMLFLKNELTYDKFHSRSDRIYRFTTTSPTFFSGKHFARVYRPDYLPELAGSFPGIESYVRLAPVRGGVMKRGEQYVHINQAFQCDSTFFRVFDADLLTGNPEHVLDGPGSMVITESLAKRAFGSIDPVGQILTLPAGQYYGKESDFVIRGIMRDFPQNSHFHPEFVTTPNERSALESWAWTYLLLKEKADPGMIISGSRDFFVSHYQADPAAFDLSAHLQKITDIHLHSRKTREIEANSNITVIYSLSIAALLLLFIALVNYTNLNVGMAGYSDRYLFIGKVFGASNRLNLKYFLTEGIIITLTSLVISFMIIALSVNYIHNRFLLNLFTGNVPYILLISALFSLLALLAGSLPLLRQFTATIRSSLDLTGNGSFKRKGVNKGLIVLQNTISIVLIIAVFVIHRQTSYALKASLGARVTDMVSMDVHQLVQQRFSVFKEELLKHGSIQFVSAMLEPPGGEANDMFRFTMEGFAVDETSQSHDMIGVFPCDYSFASLFNLEFIGGSNFSESFSDNEGAGEYIINETAMRRLNYTDPDEIVGKGFGLISNQEGIPIPYGKIIGVVKDFHLSSLRREIEPMVLFKRKELWLINLVISFQPGMQATAISDLERVWTEIFPEYPLQYEYVDSMYKDVYSTEILQASLLAGFTLIALFICSMGLLGMSLLTLQRRIKEIGIRIVNGARTRQMMIMLGWVFIKWIILSFVMAVPIAYLAMRKWLEGFVYKTDLSWWLFTLAGAIAVAIALLTVSVQTWKASRRNPVEALRYE